MAVSQCTCDSPLCKESWICKMLGEYRIAWRVVNDLGGYEHIKTRQDVLDYLESECEILVK